MLKISVYVISIHIVLLLFFDCRLPSKLLAILSPRPKIDSGNGMGHNNGLPFDGELGRYLGNCFLKDGFRPLCQYDNLPQHEKKIFCDLRTNRGLLELLFLQEPKIHFA